MADVNAGTNRLIGQDRELATLASFLGEAIHKEQLNADLPAFVMSVGAGQ